MTSRREPPIRQKSGRRAPRMLADGTHLTRAQAIARIASLLMVDPQNVEALRLVSLFFIDPEELAEAGLPYEQLKILERRLSFW